MARGILDKAQNYIKQIGGKFITPRDAQRVCQRSNFLNATQDGGIRTAGRTPRVVEMALFDLLGNPIATRITRSAASALDRLAARSSFFKTYLKAGFEGIIGLSWANTDFGKSANQAFKSGARFDRFPTTFNLQLRSAASESVGLEL